MENLAYKKLGLDVSFRVASSIVWVLMEEKRCQYCGGFIASIELHVNAGLPAVLHVSRKYEQP